MANLPKLISQLPSASELTGSEFIPISQSGITKKAAANLFGKTKTLNQISPDVSGNISISGSDIPIDSNVFIQNIPVSANTIQKALETLDLLTTSSPSAGLLTEEITVYGVSQGSYQNLDIITIGTPLETIIKNMLQTIIPPTYYNPTLTLIGSGTLSIEAGTSITPTLTPTWTQNDAGNQTAYGLTKNTVSLYTNSVASAFSDTTFVIGDESIVYRASVDYNTGVVKNDNQGNPYPTGQISAGTILSSNVTYYGRRKLFYDSSTSNSAPTLSSEIRSFGSSVLNPANGTTFTISIPVGTRRICFAYPATLRDVNSVKYVELGNAEIKDTFTQTLINVEGVSGFTAINYKVYTYISAVAFGSTATYNVTI